MAMMLAAMLLAAQAAPATTPTCTTPAPVPAELAGWLPQRRAVAAKAMNVRAVPALPIGAGTTATLAPFAAVTYPLTPAKTAAPGTYGGLFAVRVTQTGRYRVALGGGAWIDLVRDGKAQASVGHSHGPACSGVRKMVDFALTPGSYVLELSGSASPNLTLMVAALAR